MRTQFIDPAKGKISRFLKENHVVFVWSAVDMSSIPHGVINHRLSDNPKAKLVIQKERKFSIDELTGMKK